MTSAVPSNAVNVFQLQAQQIAQASAPSKPELIYQDAVQQIRQNRLSNNISDEQFQLITSKINIEALLEEVEKAKVQNRASSNVGVRMFRKASKASLETLERFKEAVDIMVQSNPAIASLVWGGLRFLLIIARDIFDTFERLIELGQTINFCLERFSIYMEVFDLKGLLRDRLVLFYQEIILFCLQAAKAYERGKTKTLGAAIWSSLKRPFESLLQKLTRYADEVDKAANAEHMRSSAKSRKRILSGQGKNPPSLSSSPPATRNFNVPDLLSRHFVGRKDILIGLHKCLVGSNDRSRPRRAALWGLPGVGKSQVALRYAQDTSQKYKHVFHIRADSKSQLISDYRVVAELLRLIDREEEANADEQLIIKTLNQWLTNTPEWLLIFDNVCDLRALRQILPTAGTGDMLFTTRDSDTARSLGNPEADFEVKPLSSDYAVELVGKFVKPDIMDERMVATARALHQLVDGLPIAIEQTVTLAGLRKVTLEQMVQQLQKRRQEVMDQQYQTSLHEIHSSTGALFAMATESLTSRNPEAAALFKIMIYLDTTAIPIELLEEGGSRLSQYFDRIVAYDRGAIRTAKEEQMRANQLMNGNRTQSPRYPWKFTRDVRNLFRTQESPRTVGRADSTYDISLQDFVKEDRHIRDVLEATNRIDHALLDLQTAGLIQIYNTRTVTIHDLVRDLNVEMLTPKTTASNQAQPHLAMTLVYLAFPVPQTPNRFANFDKCTLYHPHASSVLHHCKGFLNDTTAGPDLMHIVASVLHSRHQSKPSSFPSSDEEQSPRKAYHLAYSGYMRSWSRLRAQVPDLAIAHEARADFTLELRGAVYNRIVSTYERFGQAPRRAIDTALKLGFLAASDKDYPDAKKWISAAAKGYKGLLGPEHDLTFDTMGFLIHVLSDMHAYEDALDVALKRVDLCKSRFGPLRLSMDGAVCSAALGKLYRRLGHADVAVEWYLVSLRGVECIYGSDSTVLPATLLILASLSRELHRYEKAVEYASRGHDLLNGEDENHMRKNEIRCELALCLEGVGKNPEAMELLRETLTALLPGYTMDAYRKLLELLQPLVLKAVWDFVRLGMGEGDGDFSGGVDGDLIFEAEWVHGVLGLD